MSTITTPDTEAGLKRFNICTGSATTARAELKALDALINRIKAAWSRCYGNFVNRKGKQTYPEHVEQYAKDGVTAWVSCDDASARCKDGGAHEPCLQRVVNPLSDPDKHQSQAEQKRLNVGDPLYIKGQGRKRTCCSKCHKEVVPVLHLKPGLRFISHAVNDNQAKSGGAA